MLCLGKQFLSDLKVAEEEELDAKKIHSLKTGERLEPSLEIIAHINQGQITRLLEWQADWAETIEQVSKFQALWFYALMSVVEKPLHPDIVSALRSFVYVCAKVGFDLVVFSYRCSLK